MNTHRKPRARLLAALATCALLAGCAVNPAQDARKMLEEGRGEEALALLERTAREHPDDASLRAEYFHQRSLLVAQWLSQAETLRLAAQFELADALYQRVLKYDAGNARATAGSAQIETDKRHRAIVAAAQKLVQQEKYREAQDVLRPVLAEDPGQRDARRLQRAIDERLLKPAISSAQLSAAAAKPISLELRDVSLRSAFDVLAHASGINFVFDKDTRADQRTSLVVRDATVEEAMKILLLTNQLQHKVLNDNTVLVFPNTVQKLREYQELVVRAFYLANADAKQTANMIRTVVKTRDLFVDEKLNLLVMKDTPEAIRLAEKLVAAQDLAEPEVMLEVEVLEVASSRLLDLGLRFPDTVAWSLVGAEGTPGSVTLPEWIQRDSSLVRLSFSDPLFLLSLHQQDGTTRVLANPRIRVRNKEKAQIHIGDRLPVITTTAAAVGSFVSESVSYLDVGLKLEVETQIYLDDEVGIKVGLEVSNIVKEIRSATSNTVTYQVGTRNAHTVLRLHDGETQILAGLISNEDRSTADRVPGLGELPVLGRLFSSTHDTRSKTQIVLLITPRIVRALERPDMRAIEFSAGTEASTGAVPLGMGVPPIFTPAPQPAPQTPTTPPYGQPTPPPGSPAPPAPPTGSTQVPFGGMQPGPSRP